MSLSHSNWRIIHTVRWMHCLRCRFSLIQREKKSNNLLVQINDNWFVYVVWFACFIGWNTAFWLIACNSTPTNSIPWRQREGSVYPGRITVTHQTRHCFRISRSYWSTGVCLAFTCFSLLCQWNDVYHTIRTIKCILVFTVLFRQPCQRFRFLCLFCIVLFYPHAWHQQQCRFYREPLHIHLWMERRLCDIVNTCCWLLLGM